MLPLSVVAFDGDTSLVSYPSSRPPVLALAQPQHQARLGAAYDNALWHAFYYREY